MFEACRPAVTPGLVIAAAMALPVIDAAPVRAEDDPPVYQVREVVVTATRIPTPREQVASSVTVIDADDIARRQQPLLPGLLRGVAGLSVMQSGGPGGQTSVFTRGTNSNHTLVRLDGMDIGDPSAPTGAFDFAHLLTDGLARVEVLRGPQGPLYGSQAIGGVIDFTTARGDGPATATAALEAGSFSTVSPRVGLSGGTDLYNYHLSGSYFRTHGISVTPPRLRPAALPEDRDGYENWTGRARLGFTPTENLQFTLFLHRISTEVETDVGFEDPDSRSKTDQTFGRLEARLLSFDAALDQRFGVSIVRHDRKEIDEPDINDPTLSDNKLTGQREKVDWQADYHLDDFHIATVGAEWQRESFRNDGIIISEFLGLPTVTTLTGDEDDEAVAAFAQLQFGYFDRLFGTVGVRVDDHQSFDREVTYRVAASYLVKETDTRVKGSYGTGFKAPSLFQRFGQSVFIIPAFNFVSPFVGNPDLRPETSRGWEAGFEQALLDERMMFGATYYRNDIDDLIAADPTFTTNINIGAVRTYGIEAFVTAAATDWLTLDLGYTYSRADDRRTGQSHLNRTPKHKVAFTAAAEPVAGTVVNLDVIHFGAFPDVDAVTFQRIRSSGFTVVNLAAYHDVADGFRLFGRIDNLLDRDYEMPDGFQQPGIAGYAGVAARF